jgi:chromosome segregation ATPase
VRFFDIGDGPAPSVAGPAPDVTTLQNQLIETRGRLDQTLARLTTLQDLQSQRDSEFTELRAQLTALSESQRELRTQVGRDLPPQPGSTP